MVPTEVCDDEVMDAEMTKVVVAKLTDDLQKDFIVRPFLTRLARRVSFSRIVRLSLSF